MKTCMGGFMKKLKTRAELLTTWGAGTALGIVIVAISVRNSRKKEANSASIFR